MAVREKKCCTGDLRFFAPGCIVSCVGGFILDVLLRFFCGGGLATRRFSYKDFLRVQFYLYSVMDDQYVRGRALSLEKDASEIIEEVESEYDWMEWGESDSSVPVEKDVESADPEEVTRGQFVEEVSVEDDGVDEVQQAGVAREELGVGWTEGHEFVMRTDEVKDRLLQLEKVNEKLKESGLNRRYVATKANSPSNAYVFEDEFGPFYFKTGEKFRPSDVAALNKDESWWFYDEEEKVLKSIVALADQYPDAMQVVDSVEATYTFTDRVLKTEDEVVRDDDVFSLKEQDAIVSTVVQAKDVAEKESVSKVTSSQIHRQVESARRSIVIAEADVKEAAPSYAERNISTADEELGHALDYLKRDEFQAAELSLIQAKEKLGTLLMALDDPGSEQAHSAVGAIHQEVVEALDDLRTLM